MSDAGLAKGPAPPTLQCDIISVTQFMVSNAKGPVPPTLQCDGGAILDQTVRRVQMEPQSHVMNSATTSLNELKVEALNRMAWSTLCDLIRTVASSDSLVSRGRRGRQHDLIRTVAFTLAELSL
jgi:hypothetical protein